MRALGFLFLVVLFLSSCSEKTQLTGSLMTLIKENQLPLEKIQFYNDNPLFLERELNASEANVKSCDCFTKSPGVCFSSVIRLMDLPLTIRTFPDLTFASEAFNSRSRNKGLSL